MKETLILLVDDDPAALRRHGDWLSAAGYDLMTCPGPMASPDICTVSQGRPCPLVRGADAVVLDLSLASDTLLEGPPSRQLLDVYLSAGVPVVALADPGEAPRLCCETGVRVLGPTPTRQELVRAVADLVGERALADDAAPVGGGAR